MRDTRIVVIARGSVPKRKIMKFPNDKVPLTAKTMIPTIRKITNTSLQRLLTSLLLRSRLSKTFFSSMTIAGTTNENMIARIIPGTTSNRVPTMIKIPVSNDAPSKEPSFDIAKLKLSRSVPPPLTKTSDAPLMTMPVAMAPMTHEIKPNTIVMKKSAAKKLENHCATMAEDEPGVG